MDQKRDKCRCFVFESGTVYRFAIKKFRTVKNCLCLHFHSTSYSHWTALYHVFTSAYQRWSCVSWRLNAPPTRVAWTPSLGSWPSPSKDSSNWIYMFIAILRDVFVTVVVVYLNHMTYHVYLLLQGADATESWRGETRADGAGAAGGAASRAADPGYITSATCTDVLCNIINDVLLKHQ